jgi:hypothetical protein
MPDQRITVNAGHPLDIWQWSMQDASAGVVNR